MFHSAEIRWFFPGRPSADIQRWFDSSELAQEEDTRIDTYLLLPGCATTGVKIRQGHIEVKALTSQPETVTYDNGLAGRRASWVKWSSGVAGSAFIEERHGPERWVQVEKSRTLRLFAVQGNVEERDPAEWLSGPGCYVEFASLRVLAEGNDWSDSEPWWSVCLEAFGEQYDVQDILDAMAGSSMLETIAASLPGDASMSYPEWLQSQNPATRSIIQ